jgi:Tol biopolymer transport system component
MALNSGTKLGPYEIQAPLGAGGMGEVYRASDTRLNRAVAVKVLPKSVAGDPDRLRRFEQEAQAVAALDHPNILSIHDTGSYEGAPYLVTELLEGSTLRQRLAGGALPQRKAVEYARQMAHGLAAAHEKGIVHRDLKPENIFLTNDGRVKILDFGLAKLAPGERGPAPADRTLTGVVPTTPGTVLGTVGYMSPEQVRGQAADSRSDIFSFGAVLYEMLAGQEAFHGDSSVETMNAILKQEPPELSDAKLRISPGLERVVRHCLEKDPGDRFQSARDLEFALGALSGTEVGSAVRVVAPRRSWPVWAAAGVVIVLALVGAFLLMERSSAPQRMQFAIPVSGEVYSMALSRDGSLLAFVSPDPETGNNMIYVQRVGSGEARELPGTEGASYPAWSPDNTALAFFAGGKLRKIGVGGGPAVSLANATHGRGVSWGSQGVILYTPEIGGPIWRVNPDGSGAAQETVARGDENSHRWVSFLPDGRHYLFLSVSFSASVGPDNGIYLSTLGSKERRQLVNAGSSGMYGAGSLFYLDPKAALMAAPLDVSAGKLGGGPQAAAAAVDYSPSTLLANFTVADNGTLVYDSSPGAALSQLTWYDRSGKETGTLGGAAIVANPAIAPDGNLVAVDINNLRANNVNLWIQDAARDTTSRFTFGTSEEVDGVWARDGSMIAYRGVERVPIISVKRASGVGTPRIVASGDLNGDLIPNSWSADDKQILGMVQPAAGGSQLVLIELETGKMTTFLRASGSQSNGQISSDGKWVAYASDESGQWEIYVTTFPGAAGKWQVSSGGGTEPRWSHDGKEIFYIAPGGMLTAVPVSAGAEGISTGAAAPLFRIHGRAPISSTDLFTYDVAPDGKRFLVNRYLRPEHPTPLTIVLNAVAR